jgi:flagellar P-ring protein precursor FlgI
MNNSILYIYKQTINSIRIEKLCFLNSALFRKRFNYFFSISILIFKINFSLTALLLFFISTLFLYSARIKDIAHLQGVSGVQVIGYGLVTGLNQTGDNQLTSFTVQSVSNMLKRFGLTIPQSNPRLKNVAAVMVTATIPTFLKKGSKVDVQVSSVGDATSLQGGILLMTPLSTPDGNIIGMAQGALSVGGFDIRAMGSRLARNSVTSGRVPNGLILEQDISGNFVTNQQLNIILSEPDFTTVLNIANAINSLSGLVNAATPIDAATVQVQLPSGQNQTQIMQTISQIELLTVTSEPAAKVVINERTGTIVVGGNVQLLPAVIAHGGLEISIQKQVIIPYQAPFTIYPPKPVEFSTIIVEEEINPATALTVATPTVQDIASALNMLQVKPRDLISIFQALKEAGSLQGELIIQ